MKYTNKKYFYHLTSKRWHHTKLLKPLTIEQIESRGDSNRSPDEPDVARICVSDTIYGCLSALPFSTYKPLYVYRTNEKIKAVYPWEVCDSKITKERWITKPTQFIRCCTLSKKLLQELIDAVPFVFYCGNPRRLRSQKKAATIFKRELKKRGVTEKHYG